MSSQFSLMRQRRFLPFFLTQFLGAFNDNLYKNALIVLLTFHAGRYTTLTPGVLANLCAGLFILPFFLFSATSGQIAEKFEKSLLIRQIKLLEIIIMVFAWAAFLFESLEFMLAVLFLLGVQAAMFGPVKYAILPQHLHEQELVGGNALVESGTFIAILIGTLAGGTLVSLPNGAHWVALVALLLAMGGYVASRRIPVAPAAAPDLKINWNPATETWRNLQFTRKNRTVFLSILGISWFWFYGAAFLSQFPAYAKDVLGGDEHTVTLLLAIFSIGIGMGSLLCERLSAGRIELGLVPFGSIGLSVFALDLWAGSMAATTSMTAMPLGEILGRPAVWRVLLDLLCIGIFGGFFIVPLYALIQTRSTPEHRSRIIAGNNIMNAFFMVVAAGLCAGLLEAGFSVPQIFLVTALLNVCVAVYIYTLVPEFLLRFLVWLMIHTVYRLKVRDAKRIPDEGPVALVSNHVSVVDALIVTAASYRPICFVVESRLFRKPFLGFLLRQSRAIAFPARDAPQHEIKQAQEQIVRVLKAGGIVGFFPEGHITENGELQPFRQDMMEIISGLSVPVIPLALRGMWGSIFSARNDHAASSPAKRGVFSPVELVVGAPCPAGSVTETLLQQQIAGLRGGGY